MTRKGPFQIIHTEHQTLVYWRGRLIHKRWPDYSKTFARYGTHSW
jgi:hypothetical protein